MVYKAIIGKNIDLLPVEVGHAQFIVDLRNDKEKCKYIHNVSDSLDDQIRWIEAQRKREGDYYFIIANKNGTSLGTVGLSSIVGKCGETSRFVSYGNAIENVEANLLITDFAFDVIGLDYIKGYVGVENKKVISLQKKFGYIFDEEPSELDGMLIRYATLTPIDYMSRRDSIIALIKASEL